MFGYGNLVRTIELHLSPAKSTPLEHFVVNKTSSSLFTNSSTAVFPLDWISLSLSCVIRLSSNRVWFSASDGRSLNADKWTSVGGLAFAMHMSRIFRYWFLVIVPFLKFAKEQFLSSPVRCLWIFPGISISASMILKLSRPKMSFRTCSECRVPDIITRTLFCSISSFSFWARLIETMLTMTVSSLFLPPNNPCCLLGSILSMAM